MGATEIRLVLSLGRATALSLFLPTCSTSTQIHEGSAIAQVMTYADCEYDHGYTEGVTRTYPTAKIEVSQSPAIALQLEYLKIPEADYPEERVWHWEATNILAAGQTYPAELLQRGLILLNGDRVTAIQALPSLVRKKTLVGTLRTARIGALKFVSCQSYFLDTDFGPRRTIECEKVGEIARDEIYEHVAYPVSRIVSATTIPWHFATYTRITRAPPYEEELRQILEQTSPALNLSEGCRLTFEQILG